jgi:hypothetical protein
MTTQMIELLPLCFPLGNEQPARGMACHKSPLVQYAAAQPGNAVLLVKQPHKSDTNRLRHGVHGSIKILDFAATVICTVLAHKRTVDCLLRSDQPPKG